VDKGLFIHWGILGQTGQSKLAELKPAQVENFVRDNVQIKIEEGYLEIGNLEELIIQFSEVGLSQDDFKFRESVQSIINQALGWTGNGHSTDSDLGGGTINIFASVVDPQIATDTICKTFEENKIFRNFLVALRTQDAFEILYPSNYVGEFSY
jgi:hypothetical protein